MDITEIVAECCDELAVSEMLHSIDFSLYESMSALELLDPKMDR